MGAADVVPGVSGGTIAFIAGIYDTLLESIRRINPSLIGLWRREGLKAVFQRVNGFFLIALLSGILTSIASFAKLISWLLVAHPVPVWSFFFGLILVSAYLMIRQIEHKTIPRMLLLVIGIALAYALTILKPLDLEMSSMTIFLSGAVAICAMILPGISGSFILLLIGMYAPILNAVKTMQLDVLALFAAGCAAGLLTFSHVLSWLLKHHRDVAISFLTGLMLGTLPKIWPWKETLTWRVNSHGEQEPLLQQNLSPFDFEQVTHQPPQLLLAVFLMVAAFFLVLGLEKFAARCSK